jgi:hypothetical protein
MSLFGGLKRARMIAPSAAPLRSVNSGSPPAPAALPDSAPASGRREAARSWHALGAEGQAAFVRWLADRQREPSPQAEQQP